MAAKAVAESNGPKARKGISIRVHGEYYFKTNTQKGTRKFEQTVVFPSLEIFRETTQKYMGQKINEETKLSEPVYQTRSFINVRGLLKRRFMPIFLKKADTDFARVRFVSIDEVVSLEGKTLDLPINLMSRKQLAQFLADRDIAIRVDSYVDIDELRSDIFDYLENPEVFLKNKSKKDQRRQDEREFLEMNNLTDVSLAPRKDVIVAPAQKSVVDEL